MATGSTRCAGRTPGVRAHEILQTDAVRRRRLRGLDWDVPRHRWRRSTRLGRDSCGHRGHVPTRRAEGADRRARRPIERRPATLADLATEERDESLRIELWPRALAVCCEVVAVE